LEREADLTRSEPLRLCFLLTVVVFVKGWN